MKKIGILLYITIPTVATLYALLSLFSKSVPGQNLSLLALTFVLGMLGITVGYHRMLTHNSFTPHPAVKAFFLILGSMAWVGDPISWVAFHNQHHAYSDQPEDPHTPKQGFWHAHMGWLLQYDQNQQKVINEKYGKYLFNDPMIVFFNKSYLVWAVLGYLIPFVIGGWNGLIWGGFVRHFLLQHATWSINSVTHIMGGQAFKTEDFSRNNFILSLFTMGEGWHNNHHAFPRSAFHGLKWYQIDISGWTIRILEKLKLITSVQRPTAEMIQNKKILSSI